MKTPIVTRWLAASALLVSCASALAVEGLELEDKIKAQVNVPVTLVPKTTGTVVRYVLDTPGLVVFPSDQLRDPRNLVFWASAPGTYVLHAYTAVDNIPTEPEYVTIEVEGLTPTPPGPGPSPGPQPGPQPGPTPGPSSDLTKRAQTALGAVALDANLKNQTQRALAKGYQQLYSQVMAGGVTTNEEAFEAFTQANANAVGGLLASWTSFIKALGTDMNAVQTTDPKTMMEPLKAYALVLDPTLKF